MTKIYRILLFFAFALALGIRLYDLTDPPFDFHPTRQFRSVIIARGMYYQTLTDISDAQRSTAVKQWKKEAIIEPPVFERLVAMTYPLIGGEYIWVARVYSSLFWVSAGLALLLIGRETGFQGGGVLAAMYFLFQQYGMIASRSFQPDPLMVALMAWGAWAVIRWYQIARSPSAGEGKKIGWAALAGLLIGVAIYVKSVAGIMLGPALVGMAVANIEFRDGRGLFRHLAAAVRNAQLWALGGLAVLPTVLYYIYGLFIKGFLRQQLNFRFFPEMWRDPAFYIRWTEMATGIAGFTLLIAALVGTFLWRDRTFRGLGVGLWVGYALYSLTFPYHTTTHDYYQLPLILIVGLGLIPMAGILLEQLAKQDNRFWGQGVLVGAVIYTVLFYVWDTRVILVRQDDRGAEERWGRFAEIIPPGKKVVAITQTYGYPLAYYGSVNVDLWLSTSDADLRELAGISENKIDEKQAAKLENNDLFLVTNFNEFDRQADWQAYITTHFAVFDEGDGYIIFDLNQPLETQP